MSKKHLCVCAEGLWVLQIFHEEGLLLGVQRKYNLMPMSSSFGAENNQERAAASQITSENTLEISKEELC